jgi:hypothetical protein
VAVPRSFLPTLKAGFFSSAQTGLETAFLAGCPHRGMECRHRLWMSITGSSSIRRLKDCLVVVDLHELGPVGGRSTGRRDSPAVLLYAGKAILAFARLRTSGSKWAGSCRRSLGA